jgi:hypothetical protein
MSGMTSRYRRELGRGDNQPVRSGPVFLFRLVLAARPSRPLRTELNEHIADTALCGLHVVDAPGCPHPKVNRDARCRPKSEACALGRECYDGAFDRRCMRHEQLGGNSRNPGWAAVGSLAASGLYRHSKEMLKIGRGSRRNQVMVNGGAPAACGVAALSCSAPSRVPRLGQALRRNRMRMLSATDASSTMQQAMQRMRCFQNP